MPEVLLVDTSIFLNVLDVPDFNQNHGVVFDEFEALLETGARFLLPLATILESGNHVARIGNGTVRRRSAERIGREVREALDDRAPWSLTPLPDRPLVADWLVSFPDAAMRGLSLGDHSIVKAWETACRANPVHRVRIWSLDRDLQGYDRNPG